MDAIIITIGYELLIGDTVNTNASWIGRFLSERGIRVREMVTVEDDEQEITDVVSRARNKSDLVITTGGLGPTHDDITKKVLQKLFGVEMVRHEPTLEHIKKLFERRGFHLSLSNYAQADVPANAEVLMNKKGTAPGLWFLEDGKGMAVLPGVPSEMRYLMEHRVLQRLDDLRGERVERIVRYLRTCGVTESGLSDDAIGDISDLLEDSGVEVAYLPSPQGVTIRVSAANGDRDAVDHVADVLQQRAGDHCYGEGRDFSVAEAVGGLLKKRGWKLAVAESCTGGLLGSTITDISGSSDYFEGGMITYSNSQKMRHLGVEREVLEAHGAVSLPVALQMAAGVVQSTGAEVGLATTGIAGPTGGTPTKPVGTVWIGLKTPDTHLAIKTVLTKDRLINKERSCAIALDLCRRVLQGADRYPYDLEPHFA